MQPLKKVLSWLSGLAMVAGSVIEVMQQSGIVFAADTVYGKAIFAAGVVVLFLRNLTADKDGDGVPDILQGGPKLGALLLIVGLAACTPSPAVASPRPFGVTVEVAADTVKLTVPCTADAPAVKCRIVPRATIAGRVVTFGPVPDVAAGQSAAISATFTAAGGDTLRVNAASAGINPDGQPGPFRDGETEQTWVAPFAVPGQVRSFIVTITVVRGS